MDKLDWATDILDRSNINVEIQNLCPVIGDKTNGKLNLSTAIGAAINEFHIKDRIIRRGRKNFSCALTEKYLDGGIDSLLNLSCIKPKENV